MYSISHLKKVAKQHKTLLGFARSQDNKEYFFIKQNPKFHFLFKGKTAHPKKKLYSEEILKEIFSQYTMRVEARKKHSGAYQVCRKKFPHLLTHLIDSGGINMRYTISELHKIAKSCKSRGEFQDKFAGPYMAALRRGCLNKICSHMISAKIKWTFEVCKKEALKHNKKSKFQKYSGGAYNASIRNKWIDQICKHMNIRFVWTLGSAKKEALKYKYLADFRKKSSGCYTACYRNGWTEKVSSHMIKKDHKVIFMFSYCKQTALNYTKFSHFRQKHSACYRFCMSKGWDKKIFTHMDKIVKWDKEKAIKCAKQYKTHADFCKNECGAYSWLLKNKISVKHIYPQPKRHWTFTEALLVTRKVKNPSEFKARHYVCYNFCKNKKWLKKLFPEFFAPTWTYTECKEIAKTCHNKNAFIKKSSGAYQYSVKMGWINSICRHMKIRVYDLKECKKEARKYNTRRDFRKCNNKGYMRAFRRGWIDEICKHMISGHRKWTIEKCSKEALKYQTKIDFKEKSPRAYSSAIRNGWLPKISKHMTVLHKNWTKEICLKEAQKYKTRWIFQVKNPQAYASARKNGWIEEVCNHMPKFSQHDRHEENVAQPKVQRELKKMGLLVQKEKRITQNSRVDFLCKNNKKEIILIEVKSDLKRHTKNNIQKQISRYKKEGKLKYGNLYRGTFLISNKYGISLTDLKKILIQKSFL